MAIESAADRAAFFDADDLAVAATYTPKGYPHPSSKSRTVNGIFDHEFVAVADIESETPVFWCVADDVTDATHGASIRVSGADYTIRGSQPDGTGMTRLVLEKQ